MFEIGFTSLTLHSLWLYWEEHNYCKVLWRGILSFLFFFDDVERASFFLSWVFVSKTSSHSLFSYI